MAISLRDSHFLRVYRYKQQNINRQEQKVKLELIATTTFGLEAVAKREIKALGYEIIKTEDGKITYIADERGIVRSNLWVRTADRILLKMAEFYASEFEELFQQVKGIPWENLIAIDGKIIVIGTSVKSKLHSVPACQSIVNKAIAQRLCETYACERLEETGAEYKVKFTILKDRVTITVDTSGEALHKRGYRVCPTSAPIKETMAAALVMLSFWKEDRLLADPCCGSGTIPIEAAMIGLNIAPGLGRKFVSEGWEFIDKSLWGNERKEAYKAIKNDCKLQIIAGDIDPKTFEAAKQNADEAGVGDVIDFRLQNIKDFENKTKNGIIITNPPYGKRIGDDKQIEVIYKKLSDFYKTHTDWSLFVITTDEDFEKKVMQRPAERRRKLYNGKLKTCYYQFHGKRV